tara:strand:- start:367 stop:1194 length:828 start_codon:yes stop_codon:yes gene_type:complete
VKLDFLIIGSQKAGTTSIFEVLKNHAEIFMPPEKELNYFFDEKSYKKGEDFYHSYFSDAQYGKVLGEASPGYIVHPKAARRIHAYNPNIKLILTVRNPIDRAYSQYWHKRRNLNIFNEFEYYLKYLNFESYKKGSNGLFSRGFYIDYIEEYLKYFSREQLLILDFDELKSNPQGFFNKITSFIGTKDVDYLDASNQNRNKASFYDNYLYRFLFNNPIYIRYLPRFLKGFLFRGNKVAYDYEEINGSVKSKLSKYFLPRNRSLSRFLKKDLDHWND